MARADPLERHADAGGAGAHNAQVGFEHAAVREGSSVDVHGTTCRRQAERREKSALWRASVAETTHPWTPMVRPAAKSSRTMSAIYERTSPETRAGQARVPRSGASSRRA